LKDEKAELEVLRLSGTERKEKEKRAIQQEGSSKRKIQDQHGYPLVSLPKKFLVWLGVKLGSEIVVEKVDDGNFLNRELRLKPLRRPLQKLEEGESQPEGEKEPA